MIIGLPKEIKNQEYRVALTPSGAAGLVDQGHSVLIQTKAGAAIGFFDDDYQKAGATICESAEAVFAEADLIVKVKEPQRSEISLLRPEQILFTYLHLAADRELTQALQASGATCIAYETVTNPQQHLPLLTPMSEVAGRVSIQAAARCLEINHGGYGQLIGGVTGVKPAEVLILGGGVVGINAARVAMGMGAHVVIMDRSIERLRVLEEAYAAKMLCLYSDPQNLAHYLPLADIVIGAALVPGAAAPKIITRDMLVTMKNRSVVVDVAIDQGGCFETSRPTTHDEPTYVVEGVTHYCVTNIPGVVALTSTQALTNATLPFIHQLAGRGLEALKKNKHFAAGLNVHQGQICHEAVAAAHDLEFKKWRP